MLSVAVVCPVPFGSILGGAERFAEEFARALLSRYQVTLVSFGRSDEEWRDAAGLTHRVLRTNGRGSPFDPLSTGLISLVRSHDIIHFHTVNKMAVLGAATLKVVKGKKCFLTPLGGGGRSGIHKFRLARIFDDVFPISYYARRQYPCLESSMNVIYGGGDAWEFRSIGPTPPPGNSRFMFLGRVAAHKGLEVLIEALPDEAELLICGQVHDGEYLSFLRGISSGKHVQIVDSASDREVSSLIKSSTALVLPSVHEDYLGRFHSHPELLGLVLLEAMWHGRPVIASRVGGIPEIVTDRRTGFLIKPGDIRQLNKALHVLMEDEKRRVLMGQAGRELVEEQFRWRHVVDRVALSYLGLGATEN